MPISLRLSPHNNRLVAPVIGILVWGCMLLFCAQAHARLGVDWQRSNGFPGRVGGRAVVFKDQIWLTGGAKQQPSSDMTDNGYYNDLWTTQDGIHWTQVTAKAAFPGRSCPGFVVFDDKMWIMGGLRESLYENTVYYNDVWCSTDGVNWTSTTLSVATPGIQSTQCLVYNNQMWIFDRVNSIWRSSNGVDWELVTNAAAYGTYVYNTCTVFDNKMWVIDGADGQDLWWSEDGVNWSMAVASVPFLRKRFGQSLLVMDGKMWVIAGNNDSYNPTSDVWWSADGINWTQATAAAAFFRRERQAGVVYKNKLWVIGGYDGLTANDTWSSSDGITWQSSGQLPRKMSHSSAVYGGKMWVVGGSTFLGANASGVYSSPTTTDVWSSDNGTTWTKLTDAASFPPRIGHASLAFDGKLWIIGGVHRVNAMLTLYRNDAWWTQDGVNWTSATLEAAFPGRSGHACAVFNNKMWVIGGFFGSTYLNDAWWSSDGVSWNRATASAPFAPRSGAACTVHDNKLWISGGAMGTTLYSDAWWSTDGEHWTRATANVAFGPRYGHVAASLNHRMWIFGGGASTNAADTRGDAWWSRDGAQWYRATADGYPPLSNHKLLVFNNKFWILAGRNPQGADNQVWCSELPATPALEFCPKNLDFGTTVTAATPAERNVDVINASTAPLDFQAAGLEWTGANLAEFGFAQPPDLSPIPADGLRIFTAALRPRSDGAKTAELWIFSNDADTTAVSIPAAGTGRVTPYVRITSTMLSFREGSGYEVDVEHGDTSSTRSLILSNTGTSACRITDLATTGTMAGRFSLEPMPSLPFTLAPGASLELVVRFIPGVTERTLDLNAQIMVATDDPLAPLIAIDLRGDAVPVELSSFSVD